MLSGIVLVDKFDMTIVDGIHVEDEEFIRIENI